MNFFIQSRFSGPFVGKVDDDPRPIRMFQQLQPRAQNVALVFRIMGPARRVPQGIIEKDLPRVAGAGGNIPRIGIRDRRDSPFFQHTGDQTHGLVTNGSDGRQQSHIHAVFEALPEDFRAIHPGGFAVAVIGQGS